jgi:hypothetical protein
MKTDPLQHPTQTAVNQRHRQLFSLGLIATIVVLTISFYAASPRDPQAQPGQTIVVQPGATYPMAQSVNDYLRTHASVGYPVTIDPATHSEMDNLHAHNRVERLLALWDEATQAVLDKLRVHHY